MKWNSKNQLEILNAAFEESLSHNENISDKLSSCEKKMDEMTKELSSCEKKLVQLSDQLKTATEDLSDAEDQNNFLVSNHEKWLDVKKKLLKEIEQYKKLVSNLQDSRNALSQRFSSDKYLLEKKLSESKEQIKKLERKVKLLLVSKNN